MKEVLDLRVDNSNEDSYIVSTKAYGPEIYPVKLFSLHDAIQDFIQKYYDENTEYFIKLSDMEVLSTKRFNTLTSDEVLMTTGQILDVIHTLRFFTSVEKSVYSIASEKAPYKDYPIESSSKDSIKDYITTMLNMIIPDNVKMPEVEFRDA